MSERDERDRGRAESDTSRVRSVERPEETEERDWRDRHGGRLGESGAHEEIEREIGREKPGRGPSERREPRAAEPASEAVNRESARDEEEREAELERVGE